MHTLNVRENGSASGNTRPALSHKCVSAKIIPSRLSAVNQSYNFEYDTDRIGAAQNRFFCENAIRSKYAYARPE